MNQEAEKAEVYDKVKMHLDSVFTYDDEGNPDDKGQDLREIGSIVCQLFGYH